MRLGYCAALVTGLVAAAAALLVVACGTEEPGSNGPSADYFPAALGDRWTYDTWNLTRDPTKQHPHYTLVSVQDVVATPGALPRPAFVTNYAPDAEGNAFRLSQAYYWKNQDIYSRHDYFDYGTDVYLWHGYNYRDRYNEAVVGTLFYDGTGKRVSFALFETPFNVGNRWDVLNRNNPDPDNPTVFDNLDQKDYFGLARDLDNDGHLDSMSLSMTGTVEGRDLITTNLGQFNCWKIVISQHIVFHETTQGDVPDDSTITLWIAEYYGVARAKWYEGSTHLDHIEMLLTNAWFIK